MSQRLTRRRFNQSAAAAVGAGYMAGLGRSASEVRAESANDKLNLAVVGIGGRGAANLKSVADQNIVALCDVDDRRAGKAYEQFPQARKYQDFRKMFDALENQIDGVVISTPDHTHFHPAWWALQRGKHVYLEKPLAHEVDEVRRLTQLAQEKKLATQLGSQRHTLPGLRAGVEIVKSGILGTITEVHSWIDSKRGMPAPLGEAESVPAGLDWDLWLGPNAMRPYTAKLAPYDWRFWWEFGTGETGNWGCHILDIPFWALDLKYPTKVSGSGPTPDATMTPTSLATTLEFPANERRPAVAVHWYQGKPPVLAQHGADKLKGINNLFIGTEGTLACGFNGFKLLPESKFADYKQAPKTLEPSPGFYKEWFQACRGGKPATCNFDYSGPMAESVLLANIAYRVQGEFAWDAAAMKSNRADVDRFLRREYRKGWEV
jgi:predicted dehydrogenase